MTDSRHATINPRAKRTPSGSRLVVRSWGHDFRVIEIDRWPYTWPEGVRPELQRLAHHLATLACYCRGGRCSVTISAFGECGAVHAPVEVLAEVLAVLHAAETGDGTALVPMSDLAEQAADTIGTGSFVARRNAARLAKSWFVAQVKAEAAQPTEVTA